MFYLDIFKVHRKFGGVICTPFSFVYWRINVKKIFLALFLIIILCSCGKTQTKVTLEELPREQTTTNSTSWTVLVYMNGSSGEKSTAAINELCSYEYPSNVNIVIQTGGDTQWGINGIDGEFLQRFVVQKDSLFLKEQKQSASMGDYETLNDFLSWGTQTFPSDRYMLIFMGDGTGTEVGKDKIFGNDSLNIEELSYAVSLSGVKFDIIGFDSPYAASYEIATSLSPYADYMIASEEKCIGWNYGALADCLIKYPHVLPNELGQIICDDYYMYCQEKDYEKMATMSLLDLSQISTLAQAFDGMAGIMASTTDSLEQYGALSRNALLAQKCVGSNDMVDMASLVMSISSNIGESAQSVINSMWDTILYNVNGELRPNSNGLSVFYPSEVDEAELNNYMKSTISDSYKLFIKSISPNVKIEDPHVEEDYQDSWAWCDYVGREFSCASYIDNNSRYAMNVVGDMSIVKDVRLGRYYFSEENNAYLSIGTDNNLDCNWEGQSYTDNTPYSLAKFKGEIIQADFIDEVKDVGKVYVSPVLLNNEVAEIVFFYSWQKGKYEWLGLWHDGEMVDLKPSDKITPLHRVLDNPGNILTGKTVNAGIFQSIGNKALPNDEYILQYELEDIYSKVRNPVSAKLSKDGKNVNINQQ